jgi:hypothetical protein
MINFFGKTLVMIHTILCLLGLTWALMIFFQARDLAFAKPFIDVEAYNSEGYPSKGVLYASDYDKSYAALTAAAAARDRTYFQVKPAIDSVQRVEPVYAQNHLFYRQELKRLKHAKVPFEVRYFKGPVQVTGATNATPIVITAPDHRFKMGEKVRIAGVIGNTSANGVYVITFVNNDSFSLNGSKGNGDYVKDKEGNWTGFASTADELALPDPEQIVVVAINKSIDLYEQELKSYLGFVDPKTQKKTLGSIDRVEDDIAGIIKRTKDFTAHMTGTDEANQYVKPGLRQLDEQEFDAQRRIKEEIEAIKPFWSQAIEKANLLQFRRLDLEAQRDRLLEGMPPHLKKNIKKLKE